MSVLTDTVPTASIFRFADFARRIALTFARKPNAQIECGGGDPHVAAAAKAIVLCGNHKVEFLYLVMTGLAAYGDRSNLEARARGVISAAMSAADSVTLPPRAGAAPGPWR